MLVVFEKGAASQINLAALAQAPAVLAVAPLAVSPKVDIEVLGPVVTPAPGLVHLILLVLLVLLVLEHGADRRHLRWRRRTRSGGTRCCCDAFHAQQAPPATLRLPESPSPVQTVNVTDLKAQFAQQA